MFQGISNMIISVALIIIFIAVIQLALYIIIMKAFKNFKSTIISTIQDNLSNNIDEVLKSNIWFRIIAFIIGKKKIKDKIQSEAIEEIESALNKFRYVLTIKLLGSVFTSIVIAVILCMIYISISQLDNSMTATVQTVIGMITREEESEEEETETDSWEWDSIPDEELLYWGDSTSTSDSNSSDAKVDVSKYGLTADTVEIDASSKLKRSYNIAFVSDLHMLQANEPDINNDWFTNHGIPFESRRSSFNNSSEILPLIIECLKNEPFDAIIFGGDILDNYSDTNLAYLQQYVNQLNLSKTMYIMADHDYLTEMTTNSGTNNSASSIGISGNIKKLNIGKDGETLVLIGQNNSTTNISAEDRQLVQEYLNNTNTLFFSHVPLTSKTQSDSLKQFSNNTRNKVYYWSTESSSYYPNSEQQELMNTLYNSTSLLGTFHGHIHGSWDGELNTGIREHVFAPAYTKSIGVIRIKGSNESSGSSSPGSGGYTGGGPDKAYGNATGNCVVSLDDGNYFWYHQSSGCSSSCSWCGNWSKSEWGSKDYHLLATDGCAVYAMAIVVSNLIGDELTPLEILESAGCTLTLKNDGTYKINTSSSSCFSGRSVNYAAFAKKIAEVYNLDYHSVSTVSNGSVVSTNQSLVDSYLADGYYIWGIFDKYKTTWGSNTSADSSNTHFMGIRKKSGDSYYCFTSCRGRCVSLGGVNGAVATMNYPLGVNNSVNAFLTGGGRHAYAFKLKGGGGSSSLKTAGGSAVPGQFGTNPIKPPGFTTISDADIQSDINKGLYSQEDYNYLVALSGESSSYEGFYAVACAVRNRVEQKKSTYRNQATATDQFEGFIASRIGNPINEQVKCAAVQVLRGGESTVGDCQYFFGRVNGYHLWVEADEKYVANWSNNIYYSTYGNLHNASPTGPESNDIIVYNKDTKTWNISSGMLYKVP